jgi:alpha-1,6-mannosyltransferase
MPRPAAGPPWWFSLHPQAIQLTLLLWGATVVGTVGVVAGLVAVARGARPPVRAVLIFSFLSVAVLSVLPAAGSTDVLDYAANGRMAVTGHSPYVETPLKLKKSGDPVGRWIPQDWQTDVSVYGPAATAAEWAAAELGGTSVARITFWLKLWNAVAFGAVAVMLDRVLRCDPARRLRGHLLWTVNPLVLWEIVVSGHVDGLSAAFGLLGILALRSGPRGERPPLRQFALAGAAVGVAAAIKVPYALYGAGLAWAGRRSASALGTTAGGFVAVLAPGYVIAGRPALAALFNRGPTATWDTMYQIFYHRLSYTDVGAVTLPHLAEIGAVACAAVAVLALLRLPDRVSGLPALSPALAVSVAWLLVSPYQCPWYDVMAISLLAVYPASRLDWLLIFRLALTAPTYLPGIPTLDPAWFTPVINVEGTVVSAAARLVAALTFVWLCVFGFWGWRAQETEATVSTVPDVP